MSFEVDYCEYSEFYSETFPVARKEHECCECFKKIKIGEKHLYCRGKSGDFWHLRQCMDCRDFCMEIRDKILSKGCLDFGGLSYFLEDALTDIVRSDKLKDKKKTAHLRSMLAAYRWEQEKSRPLFFKRRTFPHRNAE